MGAALIIADTEIPADEEGRLSLNALHLASGGEKKNGPSYWLALEATKELIIELRGQDSVTGIPVTVYQGGLRQGTFAHELLAISYAGWISPSFQLQVNRVFLAYRRGELVHSSTPPELRARLDSLVEAKAKGLIGGFDAAQMALKAIRSNWHKLPATPEGQDGDASIFQAMLRTEVKVSGPAFLEPRMMTVYEAAVTAKDGEYGSDECIAALNRIGVDLHHGDLAINPGNQDLCNLLGMPYPSALRNALLTEPGMREHSRRVYVGRKTCKPLLIPLSSL